NNLCTKLSTAAFYQSYGPTAPAADATLTVGTFGAGGTNSSTPTTVSNTSSSPSTLHVSEVGTAFLVLEVEGTDNGNDMYLGDPKVYCNADALPTWKSSEID
ncbi:MAG: hypothetical protein JWP74_491, partial [Marmoricola sp.]|nr:hypothetical protein [Marmoricola sp.]